MLSFVKIENFSIDSVNRRILKFLRLGKDDIQTAAESAPAGIDSAPVKNQIGIYAKTQQTGETVLLGYLNKNQKAEAGEIRIYSIDSDSNEKTYIWLKNNGTMLIGGDADNLVRFSELKTGFDQLKSDFNSFINTFNTHVHPSNGAPTATPGQSSNASIDNAKINEIKTL